MSRLPPDRVNRRLAAGTRAAIGAVVVSTLLAIVKITAGLLGRSYALIADGVESVLDIVGSLAVWSGLRIAAIPADEDHPFGHGKAESLAALAVSLVVLSAAAGIAAQSVRHILAPRHAPAAYTLVVLVLVVVVKELLYRRLRSVGRDVSSTSLTADAWHHRSDALTSAAAFVGIAVARIGGPGFESADGWAALVACGIIAYNGVRMLRVAVGEVMDESAPAQVVVEIRRAAEEVPGVVAVEKCLVRKSGPGWLVGIHIEVDEAITVAQGHAIAHAVKRALVAGPGVLDALVHVEPAPRSKR